MSAKPDDDDVGGEGGGDERLEEETVDESQLKLPTFRWEAAHAAEVKSGEEEEEVLFKERCRLYVRTEGEWVERGTGDVKLLRHKDTKFVRLLHRQDKTLKVRANHKIDATATLTKNSGSDSSWVFTANDFADGEVKHCVFAIKFKEADKAKAFAAIYNEAREANGKLVASGAHGHFSPPKPKATATAGGAGTAGGGAPAIGAGFAAVLANFNAAKGGGSTGGAASPAPTSATAAAAAAAPAPAAATPFASLLSKTAAAPSPFAVAAAAGGTNPFAVKPAGTAAAPAPGASPFGVKSPFGATGATANPFAKPAAAPAPAPAAAGGAGASATTAAAAAAAKPRAAHVDTSGPVLQTESYAAIYGAAHETDAAVRYGKLTETFRANFGSLPSFFVRAPGRVNLIGEHIDYHGYSVLPMALAQDVVIAVGELGAEGGPVRVINEAAVHYPPATLPTDPAAPVDQSLGVKWHQYVQCGYKGAFDVAKEVAVSPAPTPRGLNLLVHGRVPAGAGVSSSSALTVASLLAVAHAYGIDAKLSRAAIGEAARKCELYIGTMSGGMDQAISCLAQAGKAARIDFDPLVAVPVSLPTNAVFVVSNTLEESAKAVDAEKRYNKRVTEGKLAAKLVAKGEGVAAWSTMQSLRQVQEALSLPSPGALLPAITKHLRPGAYSLEDVAAAAGAAVDTLFEGDPKRTGALKVVSAVGKGDKTFELLKRARHVASEAERVFAFQSACEGKVLGGGVIEGGEEAQLKAMGALLTESHASCRDDYECSSPGLDELTAIALANGAYGSRLTGAGWGGCAVSLVHATRVDGFIEALKGAYYSPKGHATHVATALFASAPGSGAAIFTMPTSYDL